MHTLTNACIKDHDAFLYCKILTNFMNGHINDTIPPLVPIGEVKLVQVQIVVWFVRTCEVWILFVLHFLLLQFCLSFCSKTTYSSRSLSLVSMEIKRPQNDKKTPSYNTINEKLFFGLRPSVRLSVCPSVTLPVHIFRQTLFF